MTREDMKQYLETNVDFVKEVHTYLTLEKTKKTPEFPLRRVTPLGFNIDRNDKSRTLTFPILSTRIDSYLLSEDKYLSEIESPQLIFTSKTDVLYHIKRLEVSILYAHNNSFYKHSIEHSINCDFKILPINFLHFLLTLPVDMNFTLIIAKIQSKLNLNERPDILKYMLDILSGDCIADEKFEQYNLQCIIEELKLTFKEIIKYNDDVLQSAIRYNVVEIIDMFSKDVQHIGKVALTGNHKL